MMLHDEKLYRSALPPILYFLFAVVLFGLSFVVSAEWEITPSLTLSETYTDNVSLGAGLLGAGGVPARPGGDKRSDFVTQINPAISIVGTNRRVSLDSFYRMNNLIFAKDSDLNRIRHQLNTTATANLVEDFLFIDGSALIIQQNLSLLGPQTTSNVFATGNRANLKVFSVSPYARYRFQDIANSEVRYTRGIVKSGAGGLRDNERDSFLFSLNSGTALRKFSWGLNYNKNIIRFSRGGRRVETERSTANFRYDITPRFGLTASGGYESNSFVSIRGGNDSPTWTVGFVWAPSERTDVNASAGQRFFGDTYSAEINHRTRLATWNASYVEDITTLNQQAGLFGAGGGLSLGGLDGGSLLGLNNFLTNRVFLQRRFNASVNLNGAKNTVTINAFRLSRKAFTSAIDDFDLLGANAVLLNNTTQIGGNVRWRYTFSPRTSANLSASFVRFKFIGANRTNDNKIYTMDITRNLQENLSTILQFRRIERISDQVENQTANAVTISLNMNF
ncbi:MAG: TIGR03016 family PEP-CTERM system-associated outer membrane protein [Betaproteobacteria bacterium]|nr:TIGR03016 family PEP-CTERM system-associated outer membrane protein [Betaproteobacteria bacterium]